MASAFIDVVATNFTVILPVSMLFRTSLHFVSKTDFLEPLTKSTAVNSRTVPYSSGSSIGSGNDLSRSLYLERCCTCLTPLSFVVVVV